LQGGGGFRPQAWRASLPLATRGAGESDVSEIETDLAAMASDELDRAMTLSWRELAAVAPWGDAYDGYTPAGRQVTVERSYIWAEENGGDILCEVTVFGGPSRWDEGARVAGLIRADGSTAPVGHLPPANRAH
jgi:hypothetical protein